tara:strand:- start:33 stop:287 length:255 start_codon:yes stop_codon:yes gene_type:complete
MSKLIFTFSNDNLLFDVGSNNKIILIENISEDYKEEIIGIIEDNKMSFLEIKVLVESWGGNAEMFLLNQLINFYKKNLDKGCSL